MTDIEEGIARYSAFFHREPDSILTSSLTEEREVSVARFPPLKGGFFKKVFAALPDATVWITSGMSLQEMNVPVGLERDRCVELAAFLPGSGYFGGDEGEDIVAKLLLQTAAYPYLADTWIGPCHTVSFPDPLLVGSDMSCIFFGVLPVDLPRLCSCTPGKATVVASVVPITAAERDWYAAKNELMALIDLFEENDVELYCDPRRPSLV